MSPTPQVGGVDVDGYVFPPAVRAPGGGCSQLFLGGAGVRGLEIGGNFVKFTAIAIYLEDGAVSSLAGKWRGKSVQELAASLDFFGDIFTGPFEKFTHVRMILPLTGQQYSEKVVENCVAHWKSIGSYSDAEAKAVKEFLHVFRDQNFPPGSSILFTHSPHGSLSISFTKDETLPKAPDAAIANKQLSEAVLESIIGKDGVSPAAKQSLAVRMSEIFKAKESCKEDAASAVKDTTKYDTEKLSAEKMPVENLS